MMRLDRGWLDNARLAADQEAVATGDGDVAILEGCI